MTMNLRCRALMSGLCVLASTVALPALAAPVAIQSTLLDYDGLASTAGAPTIDLAGNPVQNGDFLMFRVPDAADVPVGNGVDDRSKGIFNMQTDANYGAFSSLLQQAHGKIQSATLTLVLTPTNIAFGNDTIGLENGPFLTNLAMENIRPFNPDDPSTWVTSVYQINLLDFYSVQQITNFLSNGTEGSLAGLQQDGLMILQYADDAFVSLAKLQITADIPEPGTVALLSMGLLAGFAARRGQRKTG